MYKAVKYNGAGIMVSTKLFKTIKGASNYSDVWYYVK